MRLRDLFLAKNVDVESKTRFYKETHNGKEIDVVEMTNPWGQIPNFPVDKVVIRNADYVVFSPKLRHQKIEIWDSPNALIKNIVILEPLSASEWGLEVYDSPGLELRDSKFACGVWIQDCPYVKVENVMIDTWGTSREGLRLSGCPEFLIRSSWFEGDIAEQSGITGNDLLQIECSNRINPHPKHTYRDPFYWPKREKLRLEPFDVTPYLDEDGDILDGVRYYSATFLESQPNAGQTIHYCLPVRDWPRGGVITNCNFKNARIAHIFLLRVRDVLVCNNIFRNSRDAHFTAEWVEGVHHRDNIHIQDKEWIGVGSGGGINSIHYGLNNSIVDNNLENCSINVRGWGFPQIGTIVQGNRLTRGSIKALYGGTVWHHNIFFRENTYHVGRLEVCASPFYTKGAILNNLGRDPSDTLQYSIGVEAFIGPIEGNDVEVMWRGGAYAVRDYNYGSARMTSIIDYGRNSVNGKTFPAITLADKTKPPTSLTPPPLPVPDVPSEDPGG